MAKIDGIELSADEIEMAEDMDLGGFIDYDDND